MTAWTRRVWLASCAALLLLLNGCGGGGTDPTKALVRLVNASSYDALTLSLDNSTVQSSVPYGSNSSYSEVDPKGTSATVTSPTSAAVLTTTTVALSKKNHYTLLSYGKAGALASVLLTDETGGPDSGKTLLRVINTAPDAGSLDVYLTADGDSIASSTALQSAVAYGSLGTYNTIVSGTWRLQVAAAGSKTDLRLNVGSLNFPSQGVMTLVLTPGKGGVLVNALLISQQGGITNAANTQARVRVVAGVTDSAAVSASVGGTSLVSGVAAPAQTNYTLLSAGSNLPVAVTAGNVSAALTSTTLAAGGDYTLMVYGTPAAPVAVLLGDDNTLPSDMTGAKLRLVHGVADLSGAMSLQVDFVVAASGVAQGAASAYTAVDASTTAQLTATGTGFTLNTGADQTFLAGGVYSFFVVGSTTSSVPILHRDR